MGFVTEPWHSRHVLFLCECAASSALSSACLVSCCSVVFESRYSCLDFRFMSGFGHSRSMFCLVVWVCGLEFARPLALLSTCVLCCGTQFVFLSAVCIHVVLCCVARSLYIHWLRAFMLSCLVWTRGLWVYSLAACSCPVLHMAGDLFCWPCACVFVCHVLSIVLSPPILLPDYWLICPTCLSSLPSSFTPFIISLCLQSCASSSSTLVVPCPAKLWQTWLPADLFFPYAVVLIVLLNFLQIKTHSLASVSHCLIPSPPPWHKLIQTCIHTIFFCAQQLK